MLVAVPDIGCCSVTVICLLLLKEILQHRTTVSQQQTNITAELCFRITLLFFGTKDMLI